MRKLFALVLFGQVMTGCGSQTAKEQDEHQLQRAVIPGGIEKLLSLGQAYDTDKADWGNVACVTGEIEESTPQEATLEYIRNISYEKALKSFGGDVSVEGQFPSVKTEAKVLSAMENSSNDFRETHTLIYNEKSKVKYKINTVKANDVGLDLAHNNREKLRKRCRNEFVNEIDMGLIFHATMTVDFKNPKAKEKFGGNLKIDLPGNLLKVEGNLHLATEEEKRDIRIKLSAFQQGGQPTELASILGESVISCDASQMASCLDAFRNLMNYGKKLSEQSKDTKLEKSNLKYHTESYEDSNLSELVDDTSPSVDEETIAYPARKAKKVY